MTDRAGIGMRRLSIIDLSGGHQPIFNEDGTKAIVFNGEIYNYRELRQYLLARGHVLRTDSDTETIVHLYEEHGADCVRMLRGMFAFAIWDESARTLLLARDRFGIKPLYVAADGGQLAFASELKSLVAAGCAGGELDWEGLEAYFRLGYVPAPHTPFAGVRKLEPGHLLIWREDGSCTERVYWDLPSETHSLERPEEAVLESLDESVRAHLVSDVPLAVLLSGGIDSSAVLASMALAGQTPHAYTARYLGSGSEATDETGLAAALARRYGAQLTIVDVEPDVVDLIEPIVWALDEPHADESSVPTWLITQRVAQDYKVALSGTGGDELFGGYRRHFGLLASERWVRLPAALRRAIAAGARRLPEPRGGGLGVHRLKRFVSTAPGDVPSRYLAMVNKLPDQTSGSLLRRELRREVSASAASRLFAEHYAEGGAPAGLRAALYLDYKTYLPDDLLHLSDRISMAHSLELRVPFIDPRMVERLFPLPDRVRVGRGKPKYLLRSALRDRLPAQHFSAPKRGFVGPTASWLRNELRDVLRDELSSERLGRLGFFDARVVQGYIDDHLSRRHNRESVLWALLSFSIWHRQYAEQTVTPGERSGSARAPEVVA